MSIPASTSPGRDFTPETKANIRHRYVETDEPVGYIAADAGVHRDTITRLAAREGWPLRKDRPPRDLPAALKLDLAAAELREATGLALAPEGRAEPTATTPADAPPMDAAALALRLQRAVERELSKVELLKEETGSATRRTVAAERIARTLSTLTQTLFKVRSLREPGPDGAPDDRHHDDLPADLDDFRRELARRIDAFVASRNDDGVSAAGEPERAVPPVP